MFQYSGWLAGSTATTIKLLQRHSSVASVIQVTARLHLRCTPRKLTWHPGKPAESSIVVTPFAENSIAFHRREIAMRFRFAGMAVLCLTAIAWLVWFYPFDDQLDRSGTPLGGDFIMLYVAGQVVAEGKVDELYNDEYNQRRTNQLFPAIEPTMSWPFRYPPTVAAVMAPCSHLSFASAWLVFVGVQLLLLVISLRLFHQNLNVLKDQPGWLWGIAGAPVMLESIVGGQSSLLAFTCVVVVVHLMRRQQQTFAGAVLAMALYKPNVLIFFGLGCLIAHPRMLRGFIPVTFAGVGVAMAVCGRACLVEYLELATQLASTKWAFETPFTKVHGLAPLFQAVWPAYGKLSCLLMGLALSVYVGSKWRVQRLRCIHGGTHHESYEYRAMAILLTINALFNPYVPIYDLVLLIAAFALACESAWAGKTQYFEHRNFQWIVGLLFFGPHISQTLAPFLGFQVFPILMIAVIGAALLRPAVAASAQLQPQANIANSGT